MKERRLTFDTNILFYAMDRDAGERHRLAMEIVGSIADMQSLLVDVVENVPKDEDAFQKVGNARVKADCNFQKVCD